MRVFQTSSRLQRLMKHDCHRWATARPGVGYNVLITDRAGMVIGSGDTSRIGSFHEASVHVMRTQEAAAHSAGEARLLRGVRPGVTLPIVIDGDAVGTV